MEYAAEDRDNGNCADLGANGRKALTGTLRPEMGSQGVGRKGRYLCSRYASSPLGIGDTGRLQRGLGVWARVSPFPSLYLKTCSYSGRSTPSQCSFNIRGPRKLRGERHWTGARRCNLRCEHFFISRPPPGPPAKKRWRSCSWPSRFSRRQPLLGPVNGERARWTPI